MGHETGRADIHLAPLGTVQKSQGSDSTRAVPPWLLSSSHKERQRDS